MENVEKRAIQKSWEILVSGVRVTDIIDHLVQDDVLTLDSLAEIKAGTTERERMRRLIMLATRCPMRNTFDLFLNALQQDAMYRDLARDILARRDYLREQAKRPLLTIDLSLVNKDANNNNNNNKNNNKNNNNIKTLVRTVSSWVNHVVVIPRVHDKLGLEVRKVSMSDDVEGFEILRMNPDKVGAQCGQFQLGDVITSVNGKVCQGLDNYQFQSLFHGTANTKATLSLRRPGDRPIHKEVTLKRNHNEMFGLQLGCGLISPRFPKDTGIYIVCLVEDSLVNQNCGLQVGDTVIELNGESFDARAWDDFISRLSQIKNVIKLKVLRQHIQTEYIC